MIRSILCLSTILYSLTFARAEPSNVRAQLLADLHAVGPEGAGNEQASAAWKRLAASGAGTLPELLIGMKEANDLAANWIRAAVETITDRALAAKHDLPLTQLGQVLLDTRNDPRARHLAFELIHRIDPATTDDLLGGMLQDPSGPLRRLAVEQVLGRARSARSEGNTNGAALLYQQALSYARAPDQLEAIVKPLAELGHQVDITALFGFLTDWSVIGPFDRTGGTGFDQAYPPERRVDSSGRYPGKTGPIGWTNLVSKDDYGSQSTSSCLIGAILILAPCHPEAGEAVPVPTVQTRGASGAVAEVRSIAKPAHS